MKARLPFAIAVACSYALLLSACDEPEAGDRRYAYDFRMPVGSVIAAARGGRNTRPHPGGLVEGESYSAGG